MTFEKIFFFFFEFVIKCVDSPHKKKILCHEDRFLGTPRLAEADFILFFVFSPLSSRTKEPQYCYKSILHKKERNLLNEYANKVKKKKT